MWNIWRKFIYLIVWNLETSRYEYELLIHLLKCHIINPLILISISRMNFTDLHVWRHDAHYNDSFASIKTICAMIISSTEILEHF